MEPGHIEIDVRVSKIGGLLGLTAADETDRTITLTEHLHPTRTGRVVQLVDDDGQGASPAPDQSLIAMLGKARCGWAMLAEGEINVKDLTKHERVTASWMSRIVRLAFLSRATAEAVLEDKLRADVGAAALIQPGAIPECWRQQQAMYLPIVEAD